MSDLKVLQEVLKETYQIENSITEDTDLIGEMGFDSISMIEFASALNKKLGIQIENGVPGSWVTVSNILSSIKNVRQNN